jgi:N-acetylglucosaminyl-diphospho-decaprenol L-rhamnosyltransferase
VNPPVSTRERVATVVDVGVVVVTFNSADVVERLIASLAEGLRGLTWQIVFVDNASTDRTVELIRGLGHEVIALDDNRGYAAGINRGADRVSGADSVLVLNPDLELMPGAVAAMRSGMADACVGVVAPMTRFDDQQATLDLTQRREPSLSRVWGTALLGGRVSKRFSALSEEVSCPQHYEQFRDVEWAVGAALLISRACLDAAGRWDESFFLYSEETDFCRRARGAGFAVRYTPHALVRHRGGGGASEPRLRAMMIVNKVRDYRRHHGSVAAWCFFAGNLFHEVTRAIAGRGASRTAALALLSPRRRPPELNAARSVMPR